MSHKSSSSRSYSCEPIPLKTPKIKEIASASCSSDRAKDATPHPTIIMDEYGQTPDHFYLAKKPPPSFFQVKRKLDLQSLSASGSSKSKPIKRKKKIEVIVKPKGRCFPDKPRYDTSLGQLTKKFLKLLSDAADGVINLNTACALLSVPKRRLYDITNVLEGAGLIQKTSRNNIQWMGRVSSPCASVVKYDLEREIDILEAKENKLDELIYHMTAEINTLRKTNENFHYVTVDDLKNIEEFSKKMLIGVQTSPSVQYVESCENKLVVTSKTEKIEAYLLHKDLRFMDILHPHAEYKENSYNVKIENSSFSCKVPEIPLPRDSPSAGTAYNPYECLAFTRVCSGAMWTEGDTVIKNAFITEEDDIAPMGRNFLLQTEDQDLDSLPYAELESPVDSYPFSLDDGEGLTDLFDCSFHCP